MTYLYESLSPERFQQFCQALLATKFPNVQCLPVGQPDGGRDAFLTIRAQQSRDNELYVFQVKFSRTPDRREDDFIEKVCREEGPKVKNLIKRGVKAYYLMTNIRGSAHLTTGSIDKMGEALTACLGVPSYCWWRDDLDRRVDSEANIKWSYPEIIRGSDLLQALLEGVIGEDGRRRNDAIKAYLATQYREDQEVKFKQVDLYNSLLDLFVDIPLRFIGSDQPSSLRSAWRTVRVKTQGEAVRYYTARDDEVVAAAFLLSAASRVSFPRIVLEGAPGQGKSTITQYFCQVHRMRLLDKSHDLARIKTDHGLGDVRVPFRIDLRDYAAWLSGKNPFSADPNAPRPPDSHISLESFLAFQVTHASGGHAFLVSDLSAVAKVSHISIVLDGFDEVADIPTRELVVREISKASIRLEPTCRSLQVIVTSRPAAFAKSPGFSQNEWQHFSLQSMSTSQINEYAQKWMTARQLSQKDRTDFQQVLDQKLSQPHMRDLARNPMQLAILLNLIQTKGLSLPDKRTALYDSYMDLFFSREAEKSPMVREHRDLLIDLHRYLAWVIQTEAEKAKSKGSVTEERLKQLLYSYLRAEGHPTSLVDDLFTGMIERVVALVSRVQGTFEFEVQPLREYFAARHLYETAPYSPPGSEKKGTKPERFEILARNFYWLNVTRFYCGCYSRGELSSLSDGLFELSKSRDFANTSYLRLLALMLLSDWVFTQQPITVARVTSMIMQKPGFRILLSSMVQRHSSVPLIVPERCGRVDLLRACKAVLVNAPKADETQVIASALRDALATNEIEEFWRSIRPINPPLDRWIALGSDLGLYNVLNVKQLQALFDEMGSAFTYWCAMSGRFDLIESRADIFAAAIDVSLKGNGGFFIERRGDLELVSYISRVGSALDVFSYASIFDDNSSTTMRTSLEARRRQSHSILAGHFGRLKKLADAQSIENVVAPDLLRRCEAFLSAFEALSELPTSNWRASLEPWSKLVEVGLAEFGEATVFHEISLFAAGISSKKEMGRIGATLLDAAVPLCERMRYARLKSGAVRWWSEQLAGLSERRDQTFVLRSLLFWATPRTIIQLAKKLSELIDDLDASTFRRIVNVLERTKRERIVLSNSDTKILKRSSPRLVAILAARASHSSIDRVINSVVPDYNGIDVSVMKMCVESIARAAFHDTSQWKKALSIVKRAYKMDLNIDTFGLADRSREEIMDAASASEILESAQEYPLSLVNVAQDFVTKAAGSKAKAPGDVALSEHWFGIDVFSR